jgi:hypothetical protein
LLKNLVKHSAADFLWITIIIIIYYFLRFFYALVWATHALRSRQCQSVICIIWIFWERGAWRIFRFERASQHETATNCIMSLIICSLHQMIKWKRRPGRGI